MAIASARAPLPVEKADMEATEAFDTAWASEDASDAAVAAAEEKVLLLRGSKDMDEEANALLALGNLLVLRIGQKIARCKLASRDDSIAALRAAKDAHSKFMMVGNQSGMESALQAVAQVLLYNNVPSDVIESVREPEVIFQDVMAGKYADPKNALPKPDVQKAPQKLEEIVPSAKQLDRAKFAWNTPLAAYSYSLIWQPTKERKVRGRRPRGSYDILTLNSGHTRAMTTPVLAQMRGNDVAQPKADSLVVHVLGTDCKDSYASTMMEVVQVMGCMITARVPRIVFVILDETHFDHTDTSVREPNMYPVILGLLRSLRIEAPNVTVGFVAGDAASWLSDPGPMIESIFDTVECDESEVIYKKGDPYAPLLVHRDLDEAVSYVKPKQRHPFSKPAAQAAK